MSTHRSPKAKHRVPTAAANDDRLPALGSRRRLRALAALGWPHQRLADTLDLELAGLDGWLRQGKVSTVSPEFADRIAHLYDQLSMTPGPCRITREAARRRNWYPPLAWDDDEIDDPTAQACRAPEPPSGAAEIIDEIAVQRACLGQLPGTQLTRVERVEAVRRLAAAGTNDPAIAARLDMRKPSVAAIRSRHGIVPAVLPTTHPHRRRKVAA